MKQYAYSPDTQEIINTDTPAEWMSTTTIAPPPYDPAVAGCFFRNGAWVVVASTAQAEAAAEGKAAVLAQARMIRETVLNRLTGIQLNSTDAPTIAAIKTARSSLLNITADVSVRAATDAASTKTAIVAAWKTIAAALDAAAPAAASVFTGMGM